MAFVYQQEDLSVLSRYNNVQMQVFFNLITEVILLNFWKALILQSRNFFKVQLIAMSDLGLEETLFLRIFIIKFPLKLKSLIWTHLLLEIIRHFQDNLHNKKRSLSQLTKLIKNNTKIKDGICVMITMDGDL